jgi:hypothetical protein
MKRTNWFDKSFGPVASFSGIIIFIVGLFATYYELSGLILVFFGSFIGFTNSSTTIDVINKRVRYSNNIFGIIKIGKWLKVEKNMSIGITKDNRVYRTYSRGNRILDIKRDANKIYLFDNHGDPVIPIMKVQNDKNIAEEVDKLCNDLEIPRVISKKQQQPT